MAFFLGGLRRFGWLAIAAVPVVVALRVAGVRSNEWLVAAGALAAWVGAAAVYAWRLAPGLYEALAMWDAAGGRNDAFSSAFVFAGELASSDGAGDPGRRLHVDRAGAELSRASAAMTRELPLPRLRWTWLAPLAAIAIVWIPWLRPSVDAGDRPLTEAMLAAAHAEADRLAFPESVDEKAIPELTAEEKRRLEELRKSIEETAAKLKDSEGRTPRELLAELESQARAAEEAAKKMGADDSAWASDEMLAEMQKHPDTADLASAIRDKNAGHGAAESRRLAERLTAPELTTEVNGRVQAAVDRTMQKATAEDKKKMVGEHMDEADRQLKAAEPRAAGSEFEKLAAKFQRLEQRENAQKELERLAEKIRQSGSSIMGGSEQRMRKLAGASGEAGSASPMSGLSPLGQMDMSQESTQSSLPVPGLDGTPEMKPGSRRGSVVPGTGLPRDAKSLALVPGGQGDATAILPLAAPIPGTAPGASVAGAVAASGGQTAAGGLLPGRGHAPSGDSATPSKAAAAQGEVAAAINEGGDSFVRSIEGQPRNEDALRAAKKSAADFVRVQEEAFDAKSVPPSRREPVRRYFEALRKKFEE